MGGNELIPGFPFLNPGVAGIVGEGNDPDMGRYAAFDLFPFIELAGKQDLNVALLQYFRQLLAVKVREERH